MKTSQIKNFALQRTIKLKLDNKLTPQYFTHQDSLKVQKVCESLNSIKQQQRCLSDHIYELNCELMTKLKNFIQQPYSSTQEQSSKLKFRIAKKARKTDRNLENSEYLPEIEENRIQKMKPLAPFSQNSSELIFRKENYNFEQPRQSNRKKINVKKLPKLVGQKISDIQYQPQASQQKISLHERAPLASLKPTQINQSKQIQIMKEREAALTQQNKKLRTMLLSLQECPQTNTKQNTQIDFKICLSFEQIQKGKNSQLPILKVEIQKQDNNKQGKCEKNQQKKDGKQECIRVRYLQELVSHLQLMIVSQTQQIQTLRSKLAETQRKPQQNSKSSRWNCY